MGGAEDQATGLEGVLLPGDVLFVPGTGGGGLLELGTAGGFLGHVMLVVAEPKRVTCDSDEAHFLQGIWPRNCKDIWKVSVMESMRGKDGLYEAMLLLHVLPDTRRLILLGELLMYNDCGDGRIEAIGETMELWQSPEELRAQLGEDLVAEVLEEMLAQEASWSWTTAARALLRSAQSFDSDADNKAQLLREIQSCWRTDPICTSVVITFWQRCLCKLASTTRNAWEIEVEPADMVLEWFPLKADRSLPGTLLNTMQRCGWTRREKVPKAAENKRQVSSRLPVSGSAKYCRRHGSSQLRQKVEPRLCACTSCGIKALTNYSEFALCHSCSDKEERCMCCGENYNAAPPPAPPTPSDGPTTVTVAPVARLGSAQTTAMTSKSAIPPRYCALHDRSEKRAKEQMPRLKACSSCHIQALTTYQCFALCAQCSEKEKRCMICGGGALEAGHYVPAATYVSVDAGNGGGAVNTSGNSCVGLSVSISSLPYARSATVINDSPSPGMSSTATSIACVSGTVPVEALHTTAPLIRVLSTAVPTTVIVRTEAAAKPCPSVLSSSSTQSPTELISEATGKPCHSALSSSPRSTMESVLEATDIEDPTASECLTDDGPCESASTIEASVL